MNGSRSTLVECGLELHKRDLLLNAHHQSNSNYGDSFNVLQAILVSDQTMLVMKYEFLVVSTSIFLHLN